MLAEAAIRKIEVDRLHRGDTLETPPETSSDASDQQRRQGDRRDGTPSASTCPRRTSWTAPQLLAEVFTPSKFAVPGIVAEGCNILAGGPKVGKSWLALGISVAVSTGGKALGKIDVKQGSVLYLALEDTGRRLQDRLRKVLGPNPAPPGLTFTTACPPLPAGGADRIEGWLKANGDARLVVIDVLAKVRGITPPGVQAYDADYTAISRAKSIADRYEVAVVLVHHDRKADADDFVNAISGTHGISGAADALLLLKRTRGDADGVLHVTGRDIDETRYALNFDPKLGLWTALEGDPIQHIIHETRATILAHIKTHPGQGPKQIADATGLSHDLVKKTCPRMAEDGQLATDGRGHYRPIETLFDDPPETRASPAGVSLPSPLSPPQVTGHNGVSPQVSPTVPDAAPEAS
jgi:hypothetical protein